MSYWGGGYPPYVSVAERRAKAEKAIAKATKAGKNFAPITAYRGAVAKSFWGKAWCDNLLAYSDYANRLPRGATYVRNGSVIDLQVNAGEVQARVMGSSLYTVEVNVQPVLAPKWQAICTDCASSIDTLVELLQGKLAKPVMERICTPKTGLFPAPNEIQFSCSCPDSAGMCKHIAAVLYGIGARLDTQPDLLFALRKVNAKDLVAQAGSGLSTTRKRATSAKVLDDAALADVFGLEMDATADAVTSAKKPKAVPNPVLKRKTAPKPIATAAKPPAKKAAKAATPAVKSAAKPPAKSAVKSPDKSPTKPPVKSPAKSVVKVASQTTKVAVKAKPSKPVVKTTAKKTAPAKPKKKAAA
jgi:uncharacterized Zn finger protein